MMITGLKSGLLNEPRFPRNYILTTSIRDSFLLLLCNGLTHIYDDNWSETRAFECEFDDEVWSKYWERWKFKTELDESLNNCEFWNNSKSLSRLDTCTIIIGNIVIAMGEVGNPDIHRKHHQNYHHWKYQHCDHPETGRLSTCTPSASDYKPPALPWTLKTGDFFTFTNFSI